MLTTTLLTLAQAAVAAQPPCAVPVRSLSATRVAALIGEHFTGLPLPRPLGAVTGYRVTYPVTLLDGRTITASGLLIDPAGATPSLTVVLHPGTHFGEVESPSTAYVLGSWFGWWPKWSQASEAVLLGGLGYTVLVPDGVGYAASACEQHPYLDRTSEAAASVGLLAALRVIDAQRPQIAWDGRVVPYGYSAGGHAAASTLRALEGGALPTARPIGAAFGAAPHDLFTTGLGGFVVDAVPATVNFGYVAVAWNRVYGWNRPWSAIFQAPYDSTAPYAVSGALTSDEAAVALGVPPSTAFQPAFIGGLLGGVDLPFLGALIANSTLADRPQVPVLLFHSAGDQTVPVFNTQAAAVAFGNSAPVVLAPLGADGQFADIGGHTAPTTLGTWLGTVIGFLDTVSVQTAN